MRDILNNNRKTWIERQNMKSDEYFIQQHLDKLDNEMTRYEARWGVGVLPRIVSQELAKKWEAQCEKLTAAIVSSDVYNIEELVAGSVRGLAALDKNARDLGHSSHEVPLSWATQLPDGQELIVVANNFDAATLQPHSKGSIVMTLGEIANLIFEKRKIYDAPVGKKTVKQVEAFDNWQNGDEMPF